MIHLADPDLGFIGFLVAGMIPLFGEWILFQGNKRKPIQNLTENRME